MIGKTREMDYLGRNWPLYIIIIRKIEENYYVIYAIISLLCSTRTNEILFVGVLNPFFTSIVVLSSSYYLLASSVVVVFVVRWYSKWVSSYR